MKRAGRSAQESTQAVQQPEDPILDLPALIERRRSALKPREVACFLSLSLNQIYALIKQGKMHAAYRIDGAWRFDPKLLAAWLRSKAA